MDYGHTLNLKNKNKPIGSCIAVWIFGSDKLKFCGELVMISTLSCVKDDFRRTTLWMIELVPDEHRKWQRCLKPRASPSASNVVIKGICRWETAIMGWRSSWDSIWKTQWPILSFVRSCVRKYGGQGVAFLGWGSVDKWKKIMNLSYPVSEAEVRWRLSRRLCRHGTIFAYKGSTEKYYTSRINKWNFLSPFFCDVNLLRLNHPPSVWMYSSW